MVLKTRAAVDLDFEISPGESTETTFASYGVKRDSLLFDMSPHMHLRGSWFKFEALYPNGRREVLLSVPKYDFKWQHNYRLKEPKRLPAGTWISPGTSGAGGPAWATCVTDTAAARATAPASSRRWKRIRRDMRVPPDEGPSRARFADVPEILE